MKFFGIWMAGLAAVLLFFVSLQPTMAQTRPPTCALTVTPGVIYIGESVTLRWQSSNATVGTITNVGSVSANGSINLLPSSAAVTRYVGTFTGPGGKVECAASVVVSPGGGGASGGSNIPTPYAPPTPYSPTPYTTGDQGVPTTYSGGSTYSPTPYGPSAGVQTIFPSAPNTNESNAPSPTAQSRLSSGGGLVSCGNSSDPRAATACNLCDIGQLIQNIINFLILLSIPLSAALFAWAGILYFTAGGDHHKIDHAHKIFKAVFVGFVLVVTAYLIVQTLLTAIVNQQNFFVNGSWSSLECADREHNLIVNSQYSPLNPDGRPRWSSIAQLFPSIITGSLLTNTGGRPVGAEAGNPVNQAIGVANLKNYTDTFTQACSQYGVSQDDCATAMAICVVESGCGANTGANNGCNSSNACGIMQMLPSTAHTLSKEGTSCDTRLDGAAMLQNPTCSIQLGVLYYSGLVKSWGEGSKDSIAAYNGGPGANRTSVDCGPGTRMWACPINAGGYVQTQKYVPAVEAARNLIRAQNAPYSP